MQLQTTSPESKFPNEYRDVIFIQIDQHLKKLLQKYKGVTVYTRSLTELTVGQWVKWVNKYGWFTWPVGHGSDP